MFLDYMKDLLTAVAFGTLVVSGIALLVVLCILVILEIRNDKNFNGKETKNETEDEHGIQD